MRMCQVNCARGAETVAVTAVLNPRAQGLGVRGSGLVFFGTAVTRHLATPRLS